VRRDHQPPSARRRPGPLVLQLLERNPAAGLDLAKSSFRALERTVEQRRDVARIRIGFVERRGQQSTRERPLVRTSSLCEAAQLLGVCLVERDIYAS